MNFPILIKCAKNFTKNLLSVGSKFLILYNFVNISEKLLQINARGKSRMQNLFPTLNFMLHDHKTQILDPDLWVTTFRRSKDSSKGPIPNVVFDALMQFCVLYLNILIFVPLSAIFDPCRALDPKWATSRVPVSWNLLVVQGI